MGSSAKLQVGDEIMVIGNALGELAYTFTDGIVSYLSRTVTTDSGATINMFQTNAAINEGNSGGPVYNMNGEVVGIASAKYASSEIISRSDKKRHSESRNVDIRYIFPQALMPNPI